MPMLAAEMASTTAKPSMTLARNRKVGSLTDIDCGQTRFDNPTRTPVFFPIDSRNRERELPDSTPKIRAEWIRGRKFAPSSHREERRRSPDARSDIRDERCAGPGFRGACHRARICAIRWLHPGDACGI